MKWRNRYGKHKDYCKLRNPWEERITVKFAWLPKRIGGDTVWLEDYFVWETWGPESQKWICSRESLHDGSY